ncbi:anti-sigma factor antagonist [Rhodococcus sp. BP-252]|uniref:anti-sigma factor antagonist n=1 Tax=unclassified Rhodococcus (in: high G+C Gram-positive bacteria) TaxID=192944 RepID=UPI0008386F6C|nr:MULTISPECIES: anti-sigma factor antagonist [unclassified Rhodococcus (in: high G+C Gram-positive bacteria)]MBY6426857.1 anti-sigma factor antagonist [Rhodococcus sp. BP-323]MBY6432023.1 anti-sigma factor antagonist [Rhodococcus sp. BP-322]MBY6460233.1 anti-sigma factor antagonist [Rhodococcus sp. BP-260]MBY6475061.1 anti-sigma factor antagonist [Rhodococcus sp. BP-261]MBY6479707.1 anti-sigma factor antagonist [Rhodococcus sp. BP-266]MBY6519269.1 anti-sigma factor antagonist [Rhodococcus sp
MAHTQGLEVAQPPLDVTVKHAGSVTVVAVRGEIDLATAPHLSRSLDSVLTGSRIDALVVDLSGVTFLASVGLTVLVEISGRVTPFGTFAVVADGPATRRPLTITGLDRTITVFTDLDSAIDAVDS